jgi:hypothetical protein
MRSFLLLNIILLLTIRFAEAQQYLVANKTSVCKGDKIDFTLLFHKTGYEYSLYKKEGDIETQVQGTLSGQNKVFAGVSQEKTGEVIYYVVLKNDKETIRTPEIKVTVHGIPEALTFTRCPEDKSSVELFADEEPVDLNTYFGAIENNVVFSGDGVINNKLYPSVIRIGTVKPSYIIRNVSSGCSRSGQFDCSFTIKAPPNTAANFLDPINLPPFCENDRKQNIYIRLKKNEKLDTVWVNRKKESAILSGIEPRLYQVEIDPKTHENYVISLKIFYEDALGKAQEDSTDITIIPSFQPHLGGLRIYENKLETIDKRLIKACASAMRDEVLLTISKSYTKSKYDINFHKESFGGQRETIENLKVEDKGNYYVCKILYDTLNLGSEDLFIIDIKEETEGKCGANRLEYKISFLYPDTNTPKIELQEAPFCQAKAVPIRISSETDTPEKLDLATFLTKYYWIMPEVYDLSMGDGGAFSGRNNIMTYQYTEANVYPVRFKATNYFANWRCPVDTIITLEVGAVPTSNFEVKDNLNVEETVFKNLSDIKKPSSNENFEKIDFLAAYTWQFGDGKSNEQFLDEIKHQYAEELRDEPYKVVLTVTTSLGCSDSIIKYIPVFRLYEPTLNNPYINDFETDRAKEFYNSGTYKHFPASVTQNSTWKDTIPVGKDIKSDLYHRAWVTYNNEDTSYSRNEKSWVESPAFILDALERPMVRMNTWVSAESQVDGVNFQYCIMDTVFGSETWKTLGKVGQGLNWYNSSIIVTKEGFEGGWTGTGATDWQLSAHELDNVKAEADGKPVRFRFSFTSNNENPPGIYNGFAFDNFFIGERNRIVLVENFRNTSTVMGTEITDWENDNQAAVINYYVGHLKKDVINDQNKADPSARALHYGVHQLPRLAIDGLAPSMKDVSWVKDSLEKRKLTTSEFDINFSEVKVEAATGELLLKGTLYRNAITPLERPVLIQVAIIEDQVLVDGQTYSNVLRKLLPNAAGKRIASWAEGATEEIEYRWQPFAIPNSGYTVVVFIQDEQSKEIYQTNTWEISESDAQLLEVKNAQPISTSFRMPVYDEIILFPNPINTEEVQVLFNGILEEECTWDLKDRLGIVHATGIVPKGVNLTSLVLPDVPSGIYQISFTGKGYRQSAKLSVVK